MAHIHLPDGAFSLFWVAVWWIICLSILLPVLVRVRRGIALEPLRIAITAMATAVSFAVFQIDVPLFGGIHLNLTPLVGILLGPGLGALSVFVVNIFSSAVGHGGWGLIGANSLVNSTEVFLSYYIFRLTRSRLGVFSSGVLAAVAGLVTGSLVMIGIITISGIQGSTLAKTEMLSNLVLLAGVNLFVAILEGIITGFTIVYINRLRPDLLRSSTGE